MRTAAAALVILLGLAGCRTTPPKPSGPVVEEYVLPPDQARFNQPPPAVTPSGPHFIVGGVVPSSPPDVVRPGGLLRGID
jgi:hypothetical protein